MKKNLLLVASMFALCVFAQEVPKAVEANFLEMYPYAEDVHFKSEGKGFSVSFMLEEEYYLVKFDLGGNWVSKHIPVEEYVLSDQIINSIYEDYEDYILENIMQVEYSSGKKEIEILMSDDTSILTLTYSESGKFLKKKTEDL